jgi:Fe-S cluster assembly protein SufD
MTLPTPKLERWRYTNLPAKLKKFDLSEGDADITLSGMTDYAYGFPKVMNNFPVWARDMVAREAPGQEKYQDMLLWQAANDALKNGFILDVPKNEQHAKALEVTYTGHDQKQTTARQIIRVAEDSEFTLIEYQLGAGQYWNNIVTQIDIAKGATFKHYRFQENSNEAIVTHNTHIVMEEGAEYEAFTMTCGAHLSRNQVHVDMMGAHASARLNGVNILDGSKLGDTTITVEHRAPHCQSFQNYRNVVNDKSTAVFQGKVHVHQIAQKTDGYQMAKSLLLSQQATVDVKPELEIYADDVKCSHGATTGRLDDEALFYLQSRGISLDAAQSLLIQAFVNEVIEEVTNDDAQEQASHIVSKWLKQDTSINDEWLD